MAQALTRTGTRVPMQRATTLNRSTQQDQLAKQVANLKQVQFWTLYDTLVISANAVKPATAALNFADLTSPISFFDTRTVGNAGQAITSMNQKGILDMPFKAYGVGVEIHCDTDAASTNGVATAAAFVETVCMYGALELKFGGDPALLLPLSDAPAGGGVYYQTRTDTRASGANQLAASATNGMPSAGGRVYWPSPFQFKAAGQDGFTVNLYLGGISTTTGALARLQNLPALTGNLQAMIRVKFWGYRGKSLAAGTAING